ncbi:MAG: hypothetical protein J5562_05355 [Clostridia bacterium]|nr:hypothetical protein [Clostridia bacterium]
MNKILAIAIAVVIVVGAATSGTVIIVNKRNRNHSLTETEASEIISYNKEIDSNGENKYETVSSFEESESAKSTSHITSATRTNSYSSTDFGKFIGYYKTEDNDSLTIKSVKGNVINFDLYLRRWWNDENLTANVSSNGTAGFISRGAECNVEGILYISNGFPAVEITNNVDRWGTNLQGTVFVFKPTFNRNNVFETIAGTYKCHGGDVYEVTITIASTGGFSGTAIWYEEICDENGILDVQSCKSIFSGKFKNPVQSDYTVYNMEIDYINYQHVGEEIGDYLIKKRPDSYDPFESGKFIVYLPGTYSEKWPLNASAGDNAFAEKYGYYQDYQEDLWDNQCLICSDNNSRNAFIFYKVS